MSTQTSKSTTYLRILWLMVGGLFALLGVMVGVFHYEQRQALLTVEELGGMISTRAMRSRWMEPTIGYWLRGTDPVVRVQLSRSNLSPAEMAQFVSSVRRFPALRTLRVARTPLTDADLAKLSPLTEMAALDLAGAGVSDAGLTSLQMFPKLNWLVLDHTHITDNGMDSLVRLSQLKMLSLEETSITDAGLSHLHKLTQLERLYLKGSAVTESGVEELRKKLLKTKIIY